MAGGRGTAATRLRTTEALCAAVFADPAPEVREEAALALRDLCGSDQTARACLLRALAGDDERLRVAAATALAGGLRHEDVRLALLDAVQDAHVEVARAALLALARAPDERARRAAIAALDDPQLWETAAAALVQSRAHRIVEDLTGVLADGRRPHARRAAARALAGLERRRRADSPLALNAYEDADGRWHPLC